MAALFTDTVADAEHSSIAGWVTPGASLWLGEKLGLNKHAAARRDRYQLQPVAADGQ
jgi:hypothetical protein